MKQILYILSIVVISSCNYNEQEQDQEKTEGNLAVQLFEKVDDRNIDLTNDLNQLLSQIDSINNGIQAYGVNNNIDPGNVLFIADADSLFYSFKKELTKKVGVPTKFRMYEVWLYNNLEFSLFPNPNKKWVFMIRER